MSARSKKNSPYLRILLALWSVLWAVAMPLVLVYLFYRSVKESEYRAHLAQRFGFYSPPNKSPNKPITPAEKTVWIHAVSMGEVRSATALIQHFLDEGARVILTHFTPAGRRTARDLFGEAIAKNQLTCLYVPFEFAWVYRRFFKIFKPDFGLVMEIEIWPRMIDSARGNGVPLFMCNAQYPQKSFARDKRRARGLIAAGFAGYLVKSQEQARRFTALGGRNIAITGELRFDQPIPSRLIKAAETLNINRPTLCIASAIAGEDALYLESVIALQARADALDLPRPLIVYVPRAPQHFDRVAEMLTAGGQDVLRRSEVLGENLSAVNPKDLKASLKVADVLLGDSLNEMYFYLALANAVVVGGGFTPSGAHNIIEPLALKKPVLVGPQIWTIEYPAIEALAAGVLHQAENAQDLAEKMFDALYSPDRQKGFAKSAEVFYKTHSGATARTIKALPKLLATARAGRQNGDAKGNDHD